MPDDFVLPPIPALDEAQRLLDDDLPFHAHEILEGSWKAAPEPERELWQGLAQLAVGLTHVRRGNAAGAVTLLTRGRNRVDRYREPGAYGIDIAGLVAWADDALVRLSGDPADLDIRTPRLRSD